MNPLNKDINAICENIKDVAYMFNSKRILISGGNGFLGQYICAALNELNEKYLSEPCEVIMVDNLITSSENKMPNYYNFTYINGGVEQPLPCNQHIDYIIFLAGIASPYYYIKYPLETIDVVSLGLVNYLKIAKQHRAKLLFASSSEIYGDPDTKNVPTKETYHGNVSTLSDRSCYDESKRLGETLCHVYAKQNVETVIIRPFNLFGPLMKTTDYRVLPNFANNILNGNPVQLYGDGQQTRTFCYISDGIAGIFRTLLLGKSGQAYNIGNPNPEISMANLLDLCEEICRFEKIEHPVLVKKIVKIPVDYPVNGDPTRRCPDISKAMDHLKYHPTVSLRSGLSMFLNWASDNFRN